MSVPAPPRRRGLGALGVAALVVWVLVLIAGIVVVAASSGGGALSGAWDEREVLPGGGPTVAMVRIEGEIMPGSGGYGFFGETYGAEDWIEQLRQAKDDDSVAAVVLRLDTPGGAVVASDEVYRAVRDLAAEKPVVASMGDTAASGGYYIAAAADRIVANPATLTGSIGVIAAFLNLEGTMDKVGARPVVIKSGKFKDIGSPYRDMTPDERRILQRLIDDAYAQFVDAVAKGRSMPEDRVRAIADGRVISGRQAEQLGLVDRLGGLEDALAVAEGLAEIEDARLVEYVRPAPGLFGGMLYRAPSGDDIKSAISQAGRELVGGPSRPGLHYLWVQ